MWRETTKHERNLKLYNEELRDFLPEKILDFHVHVFNEGVVPAGKAFSCGGHDITRYDYNDLAQDLDESMPGIETSAVCFGLPFPDHDLELNNRFVGEGADHRRFFPLRLFDPFRDTPESVTRDLDNLKFLGLKPYPNYARKPDVNDAQIDEMLPDWVMRIADQRKLLIMLHIPRKGRLADPLNQKQIVEYCRAYPGAKIILAHVGRAYFLKNVVGYLTDLKDIPNLYFDLAMVAHWEVLEYLFKTVSAERILYASDIPIALAAGKSVEINNQYTYVTPEPWSLSISDDHRKLVFTSFLYEELRAIRHAVERAALSRDFVRALFYENGNRLLESVPVGG